MLRAQIPHRKQPVSHGTDLLAKQDPVQRETLLDTLLDSHIPQMGKDPAGMIH